MKTNAKSATGKSPVVIQVTFKVCEFDFLEYGIFVQFRPLKIQNPKRSVQFNVK